jgi:aminoglycoside phosphotransferase (APT) family kinase protein
MPVQLRGQSRRRPRSACHHRGLVEGEGRRPGKMHADEIDIDLDLVAALVAEQFPEWADLQLVRVHSGGTDNALFRLGGELSVRLPLTERSTGQVDKDLRWLPTLAPLVPLAIPMPLAKGTPAHGYPWEWGIYGWLPGVTAALDRIADPRRAATDLADFLRALQQLDPTNGPATGPTTTRGVPLRLRDAETRSALDALRGEVDTEAATRAWDAALRTREWQRPPVWLHGDLWPGNMLMNGGHLSAIIDFSALCVGDPACDLMVAWTFLSADTRPIFRAQLAVDDAAWARGRGWALSWALIALPYYLHTNPVIAGDARRTIDEALSDHAAAA